MRRQAGGAGGSGHLRDLFSMQSICWWPGPQSGPRCSYSSARHIARDQAVRRCCLCRCLLVHTGLWQPVLCLCQVLWTGYCGPEPVRLWAVSVFGQAWSEGGMTRGIRRGVARRPCGLGREVTLAHGVLGARRRMCARAVEPVGWSFRRSTKFLPLWWIFTSRRDGARSAVRRLAGGWGVCGLLVGGVVVGGWGLAFAPCGDPDFGQVLRRMIWANL